MADILKNNDYTKDDIQKWLDELKYKNNELIIKIDKILESANKLSNLYTKYLEYVKNKMNKENKMVEYLKTIIFV